MKFLSTHMPSMVNTANAESTIGFSQLVGAVRDVYSAEIYFQAMPNLRWEQFATRKEELGAQPGSNIVMPKFNAIKRGGRLNETQRLVPKTMSMSTTQLTVYEQGNAIAMTEALLQTSFYDNMAAASMLLGRDLALVSDMQLRDAARSTAARIFANGKASRDLLVSTDLFTTAEIHRVDETLSTLNVPKWENEYWVCFAHPHQISSLRASAGWVNAQLYAGSGRIFSGEVGRFNDTRFISTSLMPNGANSSVDANGDYADPGYDPALRSGNGSPANQTNVYVAVAFGEYSVGHAVALNTELRDNGTTDFGREHALAWYGIWGSGLLEASNIVVIETA